MWADPPCIGHCDHEWALGFGLMRLSVHSIPHPIIPQKDKLTKLSSGYFVCIGPEGGPQGLPAFMGRLLCGEGFGRVGTHSMAAAGTGPDNGVHSHVLSVISAVEARLPALHHGFWWPWCRSS